MKTCSKIWHALIKKPKFRKVFKCPLVRQVLFDRTWTQKEEKQKSPKKTVRAFLFMITKKNRPKKNWVDKATDFAGDFKKFCKIEGLNDYSTRSENKAAFAERTKRSWKICFTSILKSMDTSTFGKCLNSSQRWFPEKFARCTWCQKFQEIRVCPICTASHHRMSKTQV